MAVLAVNSGIILKYVVVLTLNSGIILNISGCNANILYLLVVRNLYTPQTLKDYAIDTPI